MTVIIIVTINWCAEIQATKLSPFVIKYLKDNHNLLWDVDFQQFTISADGVRSLVVGAHLSINNHLVYNTGKIWNQKSNRPHELARRKWTLNDWAYRKMEL